MIRSNKERWLVICREGAGRSAPYVLATRTCFATAELAALYARTIARSRRPIVVVCPLGVDLRDDSRERFSGLLGRMVAP